METAIPAITKYTFQLSLQNEVLKKMCDTGLFVKDSDASITQRHQKKIKKGKSDLLNTISGQENKYVAH